MTASTTKTILIASLMAPCAAFQAQAPAQSISSSYSKTGLNTATLADDRAIYDPFNLYPETSQERVEGRISALEPQRVQAIKPVLDPLGLYSQGSASEIDGEVDMSDSLPFMPRPVLLTREMAGDAGFDPLNLADTAEKLDFMRVAEVKHARIAMLAAVGWPMSEFLHKPLANMIHMKSLLLLGESSDGRVPSLLNGGLANVSPFYWMIVLGLAGGFEIANQINPETDIFDPLNVFPQDDDKEGQKWWETAEIKNGRLAMMGVVGYAVEEFVTKMGVIHQIPFLGGLTASTAVIATSDAANLLVHGFSA